ncbi:hypothetical protein ACJX0J_033541, partial [Zea mays]
SFQLQTLKFQSSPVDLAASRSEEALKHNNGFSKLNMARLAWYSHLRMLASCFEDEVVLIQSPPSPSAAEVSEILKSNEKKRQMMNVMQAIEQIDLCALLGSVLFDK